MRASCGWYPKTHLDLDILSLKEEKRRCGKVKDLPVVYEYFELFITGYEGSKLNAAKNLRNLTGLFYYKIPMKEAFEVLNSDTSEYQFGKDLFLSLYSAQELAKKFNSCNLLYRADGLEMITEGQAIEEGLLIND